MLKVSIITRYRLGNKQLSYEGVEREPGLQGMENLALKCKQTYVVKHEVVTCVRYILYGVFSGRQPVNTIVLFELDPQSSIK